MHSSMSLVRQVYHKQVQPHMTCGWWHTAGTSATVVQADINLLLQRKRVDHLPALFEALYRYLKGNVTMARLSVRYTAFGQHGRTNCAMLAHTECSRCSKVARPS